MSRLGPHPAGPHNGERQVAVYVAPARQHSRCTSLCVRTLFPAPPHAAGIQLLFQDGRGISSLRAADSLHNCSERRRAWNDVCKLQDLISRAALRTAGGRHVLPEVRGAVLRHGAGGAGARGEKPHPSSYKTERRGAAYPKRWDIVKSGVPDSRIQGLSALLLERIRCPGRSVPAAAAYLFGQIWGPQRRCRLAAGAEIGADA